MRIYLCGSTSVGKSTLASAIATKYNLPLIPEIARTILVEQDLNITKLRTDLAAVTKFQNEILTRQVAQEQTMKQFVSDRGPDFLAYNCEFTQNLPDVIESKIFQTYLTSLKQPDVITFFIRPHQSLMAEDGVREVPVWENVVRIDGMIKLLLQLFRIKHIQINSPNMQERMDLVDAVLSLARC